MAKKATLRDIAEKLDIGYADIALHRGVNPNTWISPKTGFSVGVESAVLDYYQMDGWRGYSGEGGLLLNLIKAMSFEALAPRNRATYIEALYAQNVAFAEDRFTKEQLLSQVSIADRACVERNFDLMASRESIVTQYQGFSSTSSTSMLDFFPGLERWMFVELFAVAGNSVIHKIAEKFSQDPYEFRRGWPDITIWKDNELQFVEVKAPGDKLRDSQKSIIAEFAKPLGLNFTLVGVREDEI